MDSRPEYGIGRLPADVDPVTETLADVEAQRIVGAMRAGISGFAPTGTTDAASPDDTAPCETCGRAGWWNPGAGQWLCDRHWDDY